MAEVVILYSLCSDGRLEVGTGARKQLNQPTDAQIQGQVTKGVVTWYEQVPPEDTLYLDWCKKIGSYVKEATKAGSQERGEGPLPAYQERSEWVLAQLPTNYRLFQQYRATDGKLDTRERRDAYLYGHPSGPGKRYRSPNDFFHHYWWLSTDPDLDHDNCPCKMCIPDDLIDAAAILALSKAAREGEGDEEQPAFVRQYLAKLSKKQGKKAKGSKETKVVEVVEDKAIDKLKGEYLKPAPTTQHPLHSPTPRSGSNHPTPQIVARNPDQLWDEQVNSFLYRAGELVWFIRETNSLALGLVVSRSIEPSTMSQNYRIQPLSFPNRPQPQVDVEHEHSIYPWLAFSTPDCLTPSLRGSAEHFDSINWDQLPQDENTVVDGSIFGAKAVDETFTLVKCLTPPGTPTMEFEYNGIYLGGELIWTGDAVRYSRSETTGQPEIVVVLKIMERIHTGSKPSEVYILGDVYEFEVRGTGQETAPAVELPVRVQEDLRYRSEHRKRGFGESLNWKFTAGQVRISLINVLGRWYESRRMLPIIKPELINQAMESGDVPDCGPFLNPRGNSLPAGSIGVKKPERIQAFTRSVPVGSTIDIDVDDSIGMESAEPPSRYPYTTASYPGNLTPAAPGNTDDWAAFIQTDPMDEQGYY